MGVPNHVRRTAPPAEPDEATLAACRRGDRNALERVFRDQASALERLLRRMVGPQGPVEDLLQDTFIGAMRSFPRFRGEASVRTWMSRIAVRTAQDHFRDPGRRRRVALQVVGTPVEPVDRGPDAGRDVDGRRRLERLYHHLEAIGAKKRVAFMLHVFEGHPVEEVAALTGASPSATKSRIWWARKQLLSRARKDPALADLITGGDR